MCVERVPQGLNIADLQSQGLNLALLGQRTKYLPLDHDTTLIWLPRLEPWTSQSESRESTASSRRRKPFQAGETRSFFVLL
ncbi:hypothetical protein ElyMa_005139200 [Elysia marginata]|uniref:Uncharacterized protein n=1 Tax=Elysia marginata TaxID=1093978 RepID=A0AAV4JLV8_9GAST|nr:hypothetical protein ElyMa_005139200 [Elysia marginata]